MDDEFAKDVSEFDTLKELKADLKKKITEERQKDADRVFEENLMTQVAENITADIPDVMVESQAHQYLDNFKAQISRQFPYEEYKKMTGMDDAKLLAFHSGISYLQYVHRYFGRYRSQPFHRNRYDTRFFRIWFTVLFQ